MNPGTLAVCFKDNSISYEDLATPGPIGMHFLIVGQ